MLAKAKFKIGQEVLMWSPYRDPTPLGKITKRYYMGFTFSNPSGGWYYNTEKQMGVGEAILLRKEEGK